MGFVFGTLTALYVSQTWSTSLFPNKQGFAMLSKDMQDVVPLQWKGVLPVGFPEPTDCGKSQLLIKCWSRVSTTHVVIERVSQQTGISLTQPPPESYGTVQEFMF